MKKFLLFVILSVLTTGLFAQTLYLNESFNNPGWPEGWERIPGWHPNPSTNLITIENTNMAGGEPREICFTHTSATANRYGRVLSPVLSNVPVEAVLEFLYNIQSPINTPILIGVGTTVDDGETWSVLWEQEYEIENGQYGQTFSLSELVESPDFSHSNVRLVFYCTSEDDFSITVKRWYVDNIRLYTPVVYDVSLISIDGIGAATTQGRNEVGFTFANKGAQTITSLEASYQFEGLPKVTQVFSGLSVPNTGELSLIFSEKTVLPIGAHVLNVTIDKINGQPDEEPADNTLSINLHAYMALGEKRLVIDHFTSSMCSPCVPANVEMKAFLELYPNETVISKYQMPIPVAGDIYYNPDGATRRTYYGNFSSVPSVFFNGTSILSGNFIEYFRINSAKQVPVVELRGNFNVENATVKVDFNIAAYEKIENAVVHVAINAKHTTLNVGSNGETDFYHVMRKMLPDGNGTTVDFARYEVKHFTFEYEIPDDMTEMDDLEVNIFVQNKNSKQIYNGNWLLERSLLVNEPPSGLKLEQHGVKNYPTLVLWQAPSNDKFTGYNVYINDEKVASNIANNFYDCEIPMQNNELFVVKVSAVYPNGVESVRIAEYIVDWYESVNQYDKDNVKLYPNPADQQVTVKADKNMKSVEIYNMLGQIQNRINTNTDNCTINVGNYNSGIYLLKIMFEDGSSANRKVVVK